MNSQEPSLLKIIVKTMVTHTVTYFLLGVVSFMLLDYAEVYSGPEVATFLRPTSDRLVTEGPLFYWVNHPEKRWLTWIMGISFFLVLFFPALGLLFPQP